MTMSSVREQEIINKRIQQARKDLNLTQLKLDRYSQVLRSLNAIISKDLALEFTWKYIFALIEPIDHSLRSDIAGTLFMALIPEYENQFWINELENRVNYTANHPKMLICNSLTNMGDLWLHVLKKAHSEELQIAANGLKEFVLVQESLAEDILKIPFAANILPTEYEQNLKTILKHQKSEISILIRNIQKVIDVKTVLELS